MTNLHLTRLVLQLRLVLLRFGAIKLAAIAFILTGMAAWLALLPQLRLEDAQRHVALEAARRALTQPQKVTAVVTPLSQPAQRLQQFQDTLGESSYAEQQIKTLFALAAKNGLALNQAEYKFGFDKSGNFHTYAISLPVKGSYAAIRPFCEQVLLAIPFASLDAVDFKRDAVGNATIDAKLHFTFYLDNGAVANVDTTMHEHVGADL